MARGLSVKLIGDRALRKRLSRIAISVKGNVKFCVNRSALNIQRDAKKRLTAQKAVDTGRLRSSIRINFFQSGLAADIATDVEYAQFIEFGTGQRGKSTNVAPLPEDFRHGTRSGMEARPYLFPAWEAEVPKFIKCLEEDIDKAVG